MSFGLDLRAAAHARAAAAASFAGYIAVAAKDGPIAARFKRYGGWLAAARADHRSSLHGGSAVAGCSLIVLFCHAAWFATFGCRVTAFLKERLIGSGEGKFLPAIAAC